MVAKECHLRPDNSTRPVHISDEVAPERLLAAMSRDPGEYEDKNMKNI
jgi:hypothetical protein